MAIFLLEFSLNFFSFILAREYQVRLKPLGKNVVILTAGESTTADFMHPIYRSWPRQLEDALHLSGNAVEILNIALPASSSTEQLAKAMVAVSSVAPRIVIAMWGANDSSDFRINSTWQTSLKSGWRAMKTVRFFFYLKVMNEQRRREADKKAEELRTEELSGDIELAQSIDRLKRGDLSQIKWLEDFASKSPEPEAHAQRLFTIGQLLTPSYGSLSEKYRLAHHFFEVSFQKSVIGLRQIEFFALTSQILNLDCTQIFPKILEFEIAPSSLLIRRLLKCSKDKSLLMTHLATHMPEFEIRTDAKEITSIENYRKLADLVLSHHACLIIMQYPTLSIESLKQDLGPLATHELVDLISNEQNFNSKIATDGYSSLFWDRFGNTFGHATEVGNSLIAMNLLPIVQKRLADPRCH